MLEEQLTVFFLFDETNLNFSKNDEHNHFFLRTIEAMSNEILDRQGWIFLNDVCKRVGFPQTSLGAQIGWSRYALTGDPTVIFELEERSDGKLGITLKTQGNVVGCIDLARRNDEKIKEV